MREVSPDHDDRFGLTMEFADLGADNSCNTHCDPVAFLEFRCQQEVTAFREIDAARI